jgi:hypothetical protein
MRAGEAMNRTEHGGNALYAGSLFFLHNWYMAFRIIIVE